MKVENADISWLESGLPYSTHFQDIYYSKDDALAESRHVFLDANRLSDRWRDAGSAESFHIGELGFGCGLNFLQTCKLWQDCAKRPSRLHYIAFEKYPLSYEHMKRVHRCWLALEEQSSALLAHYMDHSVGCHRLQLADGITLDLYFGDAHAQLTQRMSEACPRIQCWFLDGFSPAIDDELWQESLMQVIAASSDETTTLSSYSVAGKVRNAISNAGFDVEKIEGFGRKRHSLLASRSAVSADAANKDTRVPGKTPWFVLPKPRPKGRSAVVIGAGLAGCSTAYSLAQRGWQITVFDAGQEPASGASGIARLALRCRLFNSHSPEAEFYLQAYLFALRQFKQLGRLDFLDWETCGVMQLLDAMNKRTPLLRETVEQLYSEAVVQLLDSSAASAAAGLDVSNEAWHFPHGGAVGSASLCQRYLAHPSIRLVLGTAITELIQMNGGWKLKSNGSDTEAADVVIIANSYGALSFSQCDELPLQVSRGQSTELTSNEKSELLTSIVSGGRSVFPAIDGRHIVSASYTDSSRLEVSATDRVENIKVAGENFTNPKILGEEAIADSVALRCNTPDHTPIVGAVPDTEYMKSTYSGLARNARAEFSAPGRYLQGLYLNVAHGSNGLASCPLSAEFLASLITGENLPLSRNMVDMLNPARFLINDLKKQRN